MWTNHRKTRGDPSKKKIFIRKVLRFVLGLKNPENILEIKKNLKLDFGPCNPLHAPCTVCTYYEQHARSVQRVAWAKMQFQTCFLFLKYIFGFVLVNIWELFLKQYFFFSSKGPSPYYKVIYSALKMKKYAESSGGWTSHASNNHSCKSNIIMLSEIGIIIRLIAIGIIIRLMN